MSTSSRFFSTLFSALCISTLLHAENVAINSYDISSAPMSGWGCWANTYDGTITDTGRRITSAVSCSPNGSYLVNYTGGSGTLNDGIVSNSTEHTQLLTNRLADDGLPIVPVITLHLSGLFKISKIYIFGGDISYNANPGALTTSTIEIGQTSEVIEIQPYGTANEMGIYPNGVFDLSNSALSQIATSEVVINNFTASFYGMNYDQISIAEVTLDGTPVILSNHAKIEKCKKGGWKDLGFKNQGDCIQFALTAK